MKTNFLESESLILRDVGAAAERRIFENSVEGRKLFIHRSRRFIKSSLILPCRTGKKEKEQTNNNNSNNNKILSVLSNTLLLKRVRIKFIKL